jgi:hypothetical protein
MKYLIIFISLIIFNISLSANEEIFKNLRPDKNTKLIIKLENGDILTGYVVESVSDPENGEGVKFSTELGVATIYEDQVLELSKYEDYYRHRHRIFLLPTAEPIGNDHFIGDFELLFFYGGFGISDWVSITAGRTIIPGNYVTSKQQGSLINAKVTLMEMPLDFSGKKLSFALGSNLAFLNHNNRFIHYYGVGTLTLNRSSVTASFFYKGGSSDFNDIRLGADLLGVIRYPNGSFGLALGLDTKFSSYHDLHFIGELWNSDVTKPTNTAVFLGLRFCSSKFSADFGLSFFTEPFVAPFCSFVWTPFNL